MAEIKNKSFGGVIVMALGTVAVAGTLVAGVCIGPSQAIADGSGSNVTSFGVGSVTASTTSSVGVIPTDSVAVSTKSDSSTLKTVDINLLTTSVDYDVMVGVYQLEAAREAERVAAEQAAREAEQLCIDQALANKNKWEASGANDAAGLEEIDWTVGKEAFIAEWSERIDAYLKGTALAGYGEVFATAAWEYGIDPRWSPAISHTESTNGAVCFASHNAWGWGSSSWSSWTEAIYAHVRGLAKGYGYSITYGAASTYCPPNTEHWYSNTLSQMKRM